MINLVKLHYRDLIKSLSIKLKEQEKEIYLMIGAELEFYKKNECTLKDLSAEMQFLAKDAEIKIGEIEKEDGPNQLEIQTHPTDNIVGFLQFSSAVRNMILAEKMIENLPQSNKIPGSSMQIHISIYARDINVFAKRHNQNNYQEVFYNCIAGLLEDLPAYFNIFAPTESCYARFKRPLKGQKHKHYPTNCSWGINNRTCAIRIPIKPNSKPADTRIEYRVPSILADPYMTLAAIFSSMAKGVNNNLKAPDPIFGDAFDLQYLGKMTKFPHDLKDAQIKSRPIPTESIFQD